MLYRQHLPLTHPPSVTLIYESCECVKWRLIHSKTALTPQEKVELGGILEEIQYMCGGGLQDIEHDDRSALQKVFTRTNLVCSSPIEIPYYSANAHEPLCFHCGSKEITDGDSEDLDLQHKYPICAQEAPHNQTKRRACPTTLGVKRNKTSKLFS